jgi:hypothetical protein
VREHMGVVATKMFGMPSLKADGKAFGGFSGRAMVFKLAGEAHARALGLAGAHVFDPSGMGRAMKAWVVVPFAHAGEWEALAERALASVTGGA